MAADTASSTKGSTESDETPSVSSLEAKTNFDFKTATPRQQVDWNQDYVLNEDYLVNQDFFVNQDYVQWKNSSQAQIGLSVLGIQECKKWPNYGLSQAYWVPTKR